MSDRNAVRTKTVHLSQETWTDVGRGPALLGALGDAIQFVLSDAEPDADEGGFRLRYEAAPLPLATSARIWARAFAGSRYARAVIAPLGGKEVL